jgi:hypothetical protein
MKTVGTDGFMVEWAAGFPLPSGQQDAMFYCTNGHSWVCKVSKQGFTVDIYCDGEMRVKNLSDNNVYRDGTDLEKAGFQCDTDIRIETEKGLFDIGMNPWFDMYVEGEHIDNVYHEIDDAVNAAKMFIDGELENANAIELDLPAL